MAEKRIIVKSGWHYRNNCPVILFLKEELKRAKLVEEKEDKEVALQMKKNGRGTFLFWIIKDLSPGEEKRYLLIPQKGKVFSENKGVEILKKESNLEIRIGEKVFSRYYYNESIVRPYLWPITDEEGRNLTRAPASPGNPEKFDHIHHRSCWIAHGDVNGVDNWSEEEKHGYQIHKGFREIISGPVFGEIEAKNYWTDKDRKKILEEERTIRIYNLIIPRIIDFEINFRATEGDVKFGDTKEGGILSIRVNPLINADKNGVIENTYGGMYEKETWGKRAHWCDYSGPIQGEEVGLSIFDHPLNFRYPTYWHVRNYGLMTANPFALSYYYNDSRRDGSYILTRGKNLIFRYRLFLHKGNARKGRVKEAYHNYINPPEIVVV